MSSSRGQQPRPFLKWAGGKRQLLPQLLHAVGAAGDFGNYHEPFLGGGALFFAMTRNGFLLGRDSFLSDINQNLVDTYVGVRDHVETVIGLLERHSDHHSKRYFYQVRTQVPDDIAQKAARIIYLNRTCFNGLYRENGKGEFNVPFGRYKNPLICDENNLRAVSEALRPVCVSAKSFDQVLDDVRPEDLVYFDPPYAPISKTSDFTSYAKGGFGCREHEKLAELAVHLAHLGVKVVVSNSFTDFTKSLYKHFYIRPVLANRIVGSFVERRGEIAEILATSFPPFRETSSSKGSKNRDTIGNGLKMTTGRVRAREWLLENGYQDIAVMIDELVDKWKAEGKQTRRNWWEVLAGDKNGNPRIIDGRSFPVLRSAQIRQGMPVSVGALCRNPEEELLVMVPAKRMLSDGR